MSISTPNNAINKLTPAGINHSDLSLLLFIFSPAYPCLRGMTTAFNDNCRRIYCVVGITYSSKSDFLTKMRHWC